MGRKPRQPTCKVCQHPERARVEAMHVAGVGIDAIAKQFGVSRDSVWRHCSRHLTEADKAGYLSDLPLAEMAARAAEEGVGLLDFFRITRATLMRQFQLAAACNDRRAVASLGGRLNDVLNSIGSVTGEMLRLSPGTVVNNTTFNFISSPIFLDLQKMLVRKLATHPDALSAVVEGLKELEATAAPVQNAAPMIDVTPGEHVHAI